MNRLAVSTLTSGFPVSLFRAIYYFNNERPVRKLNGKPPVLFRTERVA